ncbi:16482_t:CDS:2 [Gigaspora margarita]|uniref:16482_t:CDS:1 n=1 Tax=Gigaspora margarita TaxID=4874 RepID=A0ABN7VVY7_GIGMA|nr:16482_t:CDS:2 [Gigaspora margarita]
MPLETSLGFGLSVMAALSSALGSFIPLLDLLFPHIPKLRDFSTIFILKQLNRGLFDEKYANLVAASVFVITVVIIMIMKAILGLSHGHGISEAVENGKEDLEVKNESEKSNKDSLTVAKSQDARLSTFTTAIAAPQIGIIYAIQLHSHYSVISQMLGATLGYVLFATVWNNAVSGFLFSMVTGALLYVILHGMLPLARYYDPTDKYCTYYVCGGLFFFAIVASLFTLQS